MLYIGAESRSAGAAFCFRGSSYGGYVFFARISQSYARQICAKGWEVAGGIRPDLWVSRRGLGIPQSMKTDKVTYLLAVKKPSDFGPFLGSD